MVAIIKNVKEEGPGSIEDFLKENSIPFKMVIAHFIPPSTLYNISSKLTLKLYLNSSSFK